MARTTLTLYIQRRQHQQVALITNLTTLATVHQMLALRPELLRFHSVSEEDLKSHGLSATDFAYLISNLHAGRIYYSTVDIVPTDEPFSEEGEPYRYFLMMAPETRRAWPLLKRFLNESHYKTRLEKTAQAFDLSRQTQGEVERQRIQD